MKKIIFLIMTMLVFTSCLTKVNVDNKGDLNLSIKWPESLDSKSVSKALLSGTDKVEIYLFHPATHTSINRTLTHTDGQVHNEEFKDLPEGVWDLHIDTYSGSTSNGNYFDFITISNDNPTYVTHNFGSPNAVNYVFDDQVGTSNLYFGDGETGLNSGYLAIYDSGSSLNNITELNTAIFYVSTKEDFSSNVLSSNPVNPLVQGDLISIFVSTTTIDGLSEMLTPSTKYYWKVVLTNSIGSTTSKTFSFTTGQP